MVISVYERRYYRVWEMMSDNEMSFWQISTVGLSFTAAKNMLVLALLPHFSHTHDSEMVMLVSL